MIHYKSGYKHQLVAEYIHQCHFDFPSYQNAAFLAFWDRNLYIKEGYAWDGASGPGIDTRNIMRGSLVHDALYQLIREGLLPRTYRGLADQELYLVCRADGMFRLRAWWVKKAVQLFGGAYSKIKKDEVKTAP